MECSFCNKSVDTLYDKCLAAETDTAIAIPL
jgi:hypothetical protein